MSSTVYQNMDAGMELPKEQRDLSRWQILPRLGADIMSAGVAAASITPIVCLIDSTIMLRARTSCSFGDCMRTFLRPVSRIPTSLLLSSPARLVFCVYFGTYATANTIDTVTSYSDDRPPETISASTSKFVGTASVSTFLTVYKDSRMAQIMAKAPASVMVPVSTYCLFTLRDAITIYASFNLPTVVTPKLVALSEPVKQRLGVLVQDESACLKTAQFLLPAMVQFVTTPIHLLGLDLYNRRHRTGATKRVGRLARDIPVAVPARIARIVPAFGVGGVLNLSLRSAWMQEL